ncbi:hypothetical protein FXN61_32205 [Lentzea sp. PSKA42]|uniref:Peptidase inhibitor family I36 n=1 Tax=Lentzea indica TaxID=2604800 RepID=A0ABX1FQF3_9PSEU|nr:peptidase inhibitor family I36 protein [Lentzea indica]NKE61187.1 hypothetical protein [Lentzea indica]
MKKHVAACVGAVLMFTGLTTAPANAATGWARCPAGSFCIFDLPNGGGAMAWFQVGSPDLRAQGMDNRASSWWNRNQDGFSLCDGYGSGGSNHLRSVFPGAQANAQADTDNRASSVRKGVFNC